MGDPRHILYCAISVLNFWILRLVHYSRIALRLSTARHRILFFAFTFFVVLPLLCMHLKHSVYFKIFQDKEGEKSALKETNDRQFYAALTYLRSLDSAKAHRLWHSSDAHSHIDVAITISQ